MSLHQARKGARRVVGQSAAALSQSGKESADEPRVVAALFSGGLSSPHSFPNASSASSSSSSSVSPP